MKIKNIIVTVLFAIMAFATIDAKTTTSSVSFKSSNSSTKSSYTPKSVFSTQKPIAPKVAPPPLKVTNSSSGYQPKTIVGNNAAPEFKQKQQAINKFKSDNANKYTSRYAVEPAKRPDYIPINYSIGGQTYNIGYNRNYGGYGYFNALGTFILYDALTDDINVNRLAINQGYYNPRPVVAENKASGFITFFGVLLCILVLGGAAFLVIKK